MPRITSFILASLCTALTAGCLQKETRHVLYLAPDGTLTWMTTESDVHSDHKDAAERHAEEQDYLSGARAGTHRVGRGVASLGSVGGVRTQVVRGEQPFTVVTDATFESVERPLQRLFSDNGLPAVVSLGREGDVSILHIRLDFGSYVEVESESVVLLEDFEHLSLVLTEGSFVESDGFDVAADRRSARIAPHWLDRSEDAFENRQTIELTIAWRLD